MAKNSLHILEPLRKLAIPVADLNVDPSNARKHGDKNLATIKASLAKFGQRKPIVVQKQGMVVRAGNGTLEAARALGWETIAAVVVDEPDVTAAAYGIADNRTSELAEWDLETLDDVLASIKSDDPEAFAAAGFEPADLDEIMGRGGAEIIEDEAPEPPVHPATRVGDLWLLGPHRVLCGDSTDEKAVSRLCGGIVPVLMATDPPYGIGVDHTWRDDVGLNDAGRFKGRLAPARKDVVLNDDRVDWTEAYVLSGAQIAYVWHSALFCGEVMSHLEAAGYEVRQQIIWHKAVHAIGRAAYQWKHEPCWYGVKRGCTANWKVGRDQMTVWEAASPIMAFGGGQDDTRTIHPTQKPLAIFTTPIVNHTDKGDAVYDPFLGSGTALIACEQTGRVCLGLELSPKFTDVILQRWANLTGNEPTLESTGETFSERKEVNGVARTEADAQSDSR